jgi:hypothetical protein
MAGAQHPPKKSHRLMKGCLPLKYTQQTADPLHDVESIMLEPAIANTNQDTPCTSPYSQDNTKTR